MTLKLFNTMGRVIQEFVPAEPPNVGLYTCGPTVWDYAHIGNLRTYIFEDLLRRTLEYNGYSVRHVMNITDVGHLVGDQDEGEDKMLKGAREAGRSVREIAELYTRAFFEDIDRLNILRPHVSCKATDHIQDMIALIRRIEERGFTYVAGGNVYFDTSRFPGYGKLALLDRQNLKTVARVEADSFKKNPADFVMWFTRSKYEHHVMNWESPWGTGYPGWHIECSAMAMRYLGETLDIHCGGVDHIPIHHTNEIAQSEAATGRTWVRHWLHGEFLLMGKEKMGKSEQNFQTLNGIMEHGYDPLDYRFLCLGAHYRSQLQYSDASMQSARSSRQSLFDRVERLRERVEPARLDSVSARARGYLSRFGDYLADDLNLPKALAEAWGVLKDPDIEDPSRLAVLIDMDRVLGLGLAAVGGDGKSLDERTESLIKEREEARRTGDFKRADEIRENLRKKGINLEDTPSGTRWSRAERNL